MYKVFQKIREIELFIDVTDVQNNTQLQWYSMMINEW